MPIEAADAPLIVHAVRQFAPRHGGLEDFVLSLCREQIRQGYRVRVVTADRIFTDPDRVLSAVETIEGVDVRRIRAFGSRRYPVMPGFMPLIADADLVHVHAIDFFYDMMALTRRFHRKPLVATTHGGFFHSGDYAGLKAVFFNTVTRLSTSCYSALVGCSHNDFRLFEPLARDRMRLIENGVNLGKFADAGSSAPRRGLITIGRFSKNKQLGRLIETMRMLIARDPSWTLDIVGVPYDENEASLTAMIADAALEPHVRLHVSISEAAIRAVMGNASIFVSASSFEGFGLALVEAMSAGLVPVVERNITFADFAERHGGIVLTGFAEPDMAALAIEEVHARLMREGSASTRHAMMTIASGFAWANVAERYNDLYRDILPANLVVSPDSLVAPSMLPSRNQNSAAVLIE